VQPDMLMYATWGDGCCCCRECASLVTLHVRDGELYLVFLMCGNPHNLISESVSLALLKYQLDVTMIVTPGSQTWPPTL
jgi:hypothetical protein